MPATFIREKPLQALKLTTVIGALVFAVASLVGIVPSRGLNGLLYLTFFPFLLAIIVGAEGLLAGYRLGRTEDPVAQLTARRKYTAIRATEVIVVIGTPAIFYALIVQLGGEAAGPGAIGLLFIGFGLAVLAYAAVLLRTLTEFYYYRKQSASRGS
ncbi:hypothetical protein [Halonotius sp. GCM10025705]|uniref:hypothetical protein n=1 Tax=Halonotius sp. GCM10025705 TaxID=3252678 RepID=UPI00361599F6